MQKLIVVLLLWCGASCCVAQAPAAGANWDHLKALPVQTKLHVASDKGSKTCRLMSVSDDALVCGKTTFARGDVKSVKLTRYGVSTAAGIGIGAGVGLAVGFGVTQSPGGWFNGDIRGVFAGLGAIVGGLATGPVDAFRGPTVYRRN